MSKDTLEKIIDETINISYKKKINYQLEIDIS